MDTQEKTYTIDRHDFSDDNSLRAWSAADEFLLQNFNELENKPASVHLYNDRFGYLGLHLKELNPTVILTHKSQEKAIKINFDTNKVANPIFHTPLEKLENKIDHVLMKAPKSLDLFKLFLNHITKNSTKDVVVSCAFMTRHFTPQLLKIAEEYFEVVEQSKAVKKARVLTLSKKRKAQKTELLTTLEYKDQKYQQYLGVFSADHIDYATQFFLEHIKVEDTDLKILDLASGNGIIGNEILKSNPGVEIHFLDDSLLATASAELNVKGKNVHHHQNNELVNFSDHTFDLIVSNPPFHFEYEVNIQIPLRLFKGSHRCLKEGGCLQLVASQHLNYKTHLEKIFSKVEVLAEDKKFIVYKCLK